MKSDLLAALRREAREAPEFGHRRSLQLRPRPRGPDPALGRRGRPADAGLHLRRGRALARRPARPSTPGSAASRSCARRSRATTTRQFGRAFSPERFFVTGGGMQAIQIAIAAVAGRRRRGDRADARPGRTSPPPSASAAPGRSSCRSISTARAGALDLDRLARRDRPGDARHLHQLAVQSDRLDRDRGRASRHPRARARARPLDHRRRGLQPLRL